MLQPPESAYKGASKGADTEASCRDGTAQVALHMMFVP